LPWADTQGSDWARREDSRYGGTGLGNVTSMMPEL
jgi:hypothetical protein